MLEKYLFASAAIVAGGVLAQSDEQREKYAKWNDVMDMWGYTWEPYEVTTDDGYILTTFHITGKKDGTVENDPNKPTVIFNHGLYGEALNWPAMFQS